MPTLMEKDALKKTFEDEDRFAHVWMQHVDGNAGDRIVTLPGSGAFEVIFLELAQPPRPEPPPRELPRIRDFIGYGARFHKLRPTEEWMKELREGEEE